MRLASCVSSADRAMAGPPSGNPKSASRQAPRDWLIPTARPSSLMNTSQWRSESDEDSLCFRGLRDRVARRRSISVSYIYIKLLNSEPITKKGRCIQHLSFSAFTLFLPFCYCRPLQFPIKKHISLIGQMPLSPWTAAERGSSGCSSLFRKSRRPASPRRHPSRLFSVPAGSFRAHGTSR